MRTIGIVTTTRADYGIYLPILEKIKSHSPLSVMLYVSGTHLSREHGYSVEEIERDGFPIAARIPLPLENDSPAGIARSMGKAAIGFADAFEVTRPDVLLVLGDRYEMHAAAVAAVPFGIPLAHLHGGELTYGAIDDSFRHSLTKLSHIHFASTEVYARRIVQMGEEPWRVIVSGAPALDQVSHMKFLSRKALEKKCEIDLSQPTILVTFHPVTREFEQTSEYISKLLKALDAFPGFNLVFTYPNADTQGSVIIRKISKFVEKRPNASIVKNFGQQGYFGMMAEAAVMVGNSSSGIIEAPSFKLPVVNIGTRQSGRIKAGNVIDSGYEPGSIRRAIQEAISPDFKKVVRRVANPYGDGRAAERIISVLSSIEMKGITIKQFHDAEPRRKTCSRTEVNQGGTSTGGLFKT